MNNTTIISSAFGLERDPNNQILSTCINITIQMYARRLPVEVCYMSSQTVGHLYMQKNAMIERAYCITIIFVYFEATLKSGMLS